MQDTNRDKIAHIKESNVANMNLLLRNYEELKFCMVDYTRDAKKYDIHGMIRFPNVQVAVMTNKPLDWSALARDRWYVMELIGGNNEVATFKIWDEKKMDAEYETDNMIIYWEYDTTVISEHNKRPIKTITGDEFGYFAKFKNVNMIKYVIE